MSKTRAFFVSLSRTLLLGTAIVSSVHIQAQTYSVEPFIVGPPDMDSQGLDITLEYDKKGQSYPRLVGYVKPFDSNKLPFTWTGLYGEGGVAEMGGADTGVCNGAYPFSWAGSLLNPSHAVFWLYGFLAYFDKDRSELFGTWDVHYSGYFLNPDQNNRHEAALYTVDPATWDVTRRSIHPEGFYFDSLAHDVYSPAKGEEPWACGWVNGSWTEGQAGAWRPGGRFDLLPGARQWSRAYGIHQDRIAGAQDGYATTWQWNGASWNELPVFDGIMFGTSEARAIFETRGCGSVFTVSKPPGPGSAFFFDLVSSPATIVYLGESLPREYKGSRAFGIVTDKDGTTYVGGFARYVEAEPWHERACIWRIRRIS